MTRKRVAILISGRGSNMAALIAAAEADNYPAEIALVLSNRADAAGLKRAKDAGIATVTVDHRLYPLALKLIAEGRVRVVEGRCLIAQSQVTKPTLIVP